MRRALVLATGGVTGALYEVGVLKALEEEVGPPGELFDLFLGAGASVAAFVSQGCPALAPLRGAPAGRRPAPAAQATGRRRLRSAPRRAARLGWCEARRAPRAPAPAARTAAPARPRPAPASRPLLARALSPPPREGRSPARGSGTTSASCRVDSSSRRPISTPASACSSVCGHGTMCPSPLPSRPPRPSRRSSSPSAFAADTSSTGTWATSPTSTRSSSTGRGACSW
jgi:hypothetical protein